jgi:ribosomal protein S18 acetylase RimI-like enzyme
VSPLIGIRPATRDDVSVIYALVVSLAEQTGMRDRIKSTPEDFLRYGYGQQAAFEALLAEDQNGAVGLSLYSYLFSSWLGRLGVYIQDIVVSDSVQGLGVGRMLLQETAQRAAARGATHLRLSVNTDNAAAIGFYKKQGLSASSEERIYHAHGAAFDRLAAKL